MNCCVRGCTSNKRQPGNKISFFRFPTKPQQKDKWLKILNVTTDNNAFVCSMHFEQKYIKNDNQKYRLLPGAIPTKNITIIDTNTRKLIPIQPKPNLIQQLPIVVVPIQNCNLIPIQTINEAPLINDVVEVEVEDDVNCSETESTLSAKSIDDETTQNSSKVDESCYILVEVDDRKDESINSQDDANIVASGFNIKELINDAKTAMNKNIYTNTKKAKPIDNPIRFKSRRWRTKHIAECLFEDMENPIIRKHHWDLALNEIGKLRKKVEMLSQRSRRLQKRLNHANSFIEEFKQKQNKEQQK